MAAAATAPATCPVPHMAGAVPPPSHPPVPASDSNLSDLFTQPGRLFDDLAAARDKTDGLLWSDRLGAYVVARYDDVVCVLDDADTFSSRPTVPDMPPPVVAAMAGRCPMRGTLLGLDNPDHDRLRKAVASFFVPRRLERFAGMMEARAHALLDKMVSRASRAADFGERGVNIREKFNHALPLQIITAVAGLDVDRWEWVGQALELTTVVAKRPEDDDEGDGKQKEPESDYVKLGRYIELHEYIADLIQQRKTDRRDDLISHIWGERDSGRVTMTDFEHLSLIPGLLLAGHETTTSVMTMGMAHLLHLNLWETATRDEPSRMATIEELVRYESAITGMKREVLKPVTIGGTDLKVGDIVFGAYQSASRDPTKFDKSDVLRIGVQSQLSLSTSGKGQQQHLGFGRGIHACLGAPLARLLLRIEMRVLPERLPSLKLVTKYEAREYTAVQEGRDLLKLMVSWDVEAAAAVAEKRAASTTSQSTAMPRNTAAVETSVVIQSINRLNETVVEIELAAPDGGPLPSWTAGAHIDIPVGGDLGFRQYSLCSNPSDSDVWKIAVLREPEGRGGSLHIHSKLHVGQQLNIQGPRNHFEWKGADSPKHTSLLIAGGIGITPLRAMISAAETAGTDYRLVYLGSSRDRMAYADEMAANPKSTVWAKDEMDSFDLQSLVVDHKAEIDSESLAVYCCGPQRLLRDVEDMFQPHLPARHIHVERFTPLEVDKSTNTAFDVMLARSGRRVHVPVDKSILEAVREAGATPAVLSTCTKGTCGTCEVKLVDGAAEHRDTVLTADEKAAQTSVMVCVSRCRGKELALDLW
ncbi:hypothetical protein Sste5346_008874 [Sporothrix stenoceras]|uniref:Cytochrome P450 n=1 Tax=Sporothrix stenoceras TaxID=5173 RepID=A0ABR3YNS4_9PEZI